MNNLQLDKVIISGENFTPESLNFYNDLVRFCFVSKHILHPHLEVKLAFYLSYLWKTKHQFFNMQCFNFGVMNTTKVFKSLKVLPPAGA